MPHECVECGDVFDDGSDEVFEGCPSCGATKFFYVKEVTASDESDPSGSDPTDPFTTSPEATSEPTSEPATSPTSDETIPETQTGSGDDDIVEAESEYERAFGGKLGDNEDETEEGLNEVEPSPSTSDNPRFERARAEEARERLMDQFETIRIVEPGSYELNLMNLYDSEEKIIALQEDGRYQVSLPSALDD